MKTIQFLSALSLCIQISTVAIAQDLCKQNYAPVSDDSIVLQKVIQQGIISPDEARLRMAKRKGTDLRQKREITVLVVHQRLSLNPNVNLFGGQLILRNCAAGTALCEVTFRQVNTKALEFVWSNDTRNAVNSWRDLRATAISQNWYSQADVILGLTEDNFTDFTGYASIDEDCQAPIDRGHLVLNARVTNSFLAHELGHILGMQHDNITNSLMNANVSLTPNTMASSNRDCYYKNLEPAFCITSSQDLESNKPIICSPNPVQEQLNIQLPEFIQAASLRIYNALGVQFFYQPRIGITTQVDFSGLPAGIYFLHIQTPGQRWVKQVVK